MLTKQTEQMLKQWRPVRVRTVNAQINSLKFYSNSKNSQQSSQGVSYYNVKREGASMSDATIRHACFLLGDY